MATEVETLEIQPEIIVQAFDVETTLEAFSLNEIEEFYIEYGGVTDPLGQLSSAVMNFIESVVSSAESAIKSTIRSIEGSIRSAISGVESALKSVIGGVKSAILSAISGVQSLVRSVLSTAQSIGSSILSSIGNAISTITSTILSIGKSITSTVQGIASSIQNVLSSFQNTITNFIQNISNRIQSTLTSITQSIQSISQSILSTIQNISTSIQNTIQSIFGQIRSVLTNLSQTMQNISQTITSTIQNIFTTIQNTIQNLSQTVGQIAASITSTLQGISRTITSGFQTFLSQLGNVLTQVQNMIQGVIQNIQNVAINISKTIQNVFTNIQTFLGNLSTTITSTIQGISQTIQTMFSPIINAIDWIRQQVTKIPELPSLIWQLIQQNIVQPLEEHVVKPIKAFFEDLWNEHIKPFFDKLKDIPSKMAEISKAFQGFINPLVGIAQFFDQVRQKFIDFITSIPNYIKAIGDFFGDIAKDPLGWFKDNVVKPLADAFSAIGKWVWERLPDWFKNAITTARDWFSDAKDWLAKGWQDFVDWVSKIPEHLKGIVDFFKPLTDKVEEFLEDPIEAVNNAVKWVYDAFKSAVTWVWGGLKWVFKTIAQSVSEFFTDVVGTITKFLTDKLCNFAVGLTDYAWKLLMGIYDKVKGSFETVGRELSKLMTSLISTITSTWGEYLEKSMMPILEKIKSGKSRQFIEMIEMIGALMSGFVVGAYLLHGLRKVLYALAHWVYELEYRMATKTRLGWRLLIAPAGMGGSGRSGFGGDHILDLKISVGKTIGYLAKMLGMYPEKLAVSMAYGWGIWLSQPMAKIANASFRNLIPIELPTLAEMRDITRRHMPIEEKFNETLTKMRHYLAMYGYNDEIITWLTTPEAEKGWTIQIKDRFGRDRKIPISLLYELPTPSDIARMMIHDLFTIPEQEEVAFESFKKLMAMKGYNEDIAKFYYLLHYKYPSMSDLWEFTCRVVAKQTWVEFVPKPEMDLGAKNPKSPVQLQSTYGLSKFTSDEVWDKLKKVVENVLRHYAKWHDYAPFTWIENWTADNLIYIDLMADIPQRIDARWMYKWQVPVPEAISNITNRDYFDDRALFLIVTSRGMHPKWVESITIAECMNALAEERTYARTGVINAFKEGFMPLDGLSKTLSHLTDVKILDRNVPVRFLEGEVKLLTLRAKYDRALDILRDYFKELLWSVSENIIPFDGMTKALKEEVTAVAKELELSNLALDESYFRLYKPVVDYYKKIRTIDRIRYWTRYMLYRLLQRFSEGFMSREEFEGMINDIVERGKLTEEEREYFMAIAQFMYDGFYKKALADGILRKLSRGAISEEEARKRLIELGLTNDIVDALIEKYAKTYTLSISTLLSYADEVYIPEELLTKKLEALGVPEDEREIVLQVFRIRPIKDERAKAIRAQIEKFIEGYIDENTLKQELLKLGKLEEEIDLIVQYAKVEKSMEVYKLRIDAILNKVKRGAITLEEAKRELSKYIVDKDVIEALIEKSVRTYTLSISQLMSYAEYVDIPEDYVKKKLEILGVPQDEIPIILQVFKIKPLRDERAKMIRSVIDAYIDGYITKELFQQNLKNLGKSPREIKILTEFADFEKSQKTAKLMIDAILNRLRRGAITVEQAKEELGKIIVDKALVDAMIEKYVRTYVWSPDKLVSMGEYVPVDIRKLVEKASMYGYPEEEVKLYPAYLLARNLSEEIGRIVTELVYLYVYDIIDEETLRKEIDRVRTLNGEVKKFGVDWIVIDDMEKELIIQRAKLRKMREQRTS